MKVKYLKSFEKDIDKILDIKVKNQLYNVIQNLKSADRTTDILNLKETY